MTTLINFFNGKKTYFVAITAGCLAAAQALGYDIPPYVYAILGSLGLYTLRLGVAKSGQ